MIKKFVPNPIEIEAIQWDGTSDCFHELQQWGAPVTRFGDDGLLIKTLEDGPEAQARHVADKFDWIIRGVKGEYYPCKPDIMMVKYKLVQRCNCGYNLGNCPVHYPNL